MLHLPRRHLITRCPRLLQEKRDKQRSKDGAAKAMLNVHGRGKQGADARGEETLVNLVGAQEQCMRGAIGKDHHGSMILA